jgi:RND family efflux transporter MFP subunit
MILAVTLIYLIMVAQFRSFLDPFIIMFAVPLGVIGVLGILWLTGTTFNIQSLMGGVFMIGIAVTNSILLVEFANRLREEGRSPLEAAIEAGSVRLRPIMMTALAMVFGLIPLALHEGDPTMPLARAVIGGLTASTALTIFVVPSLYVIFKGRVRPAANGQLSNEKGFPNMSRIIYRSSAGLAAIAAIVIAVVVLGNHQGVHPPSALAQSSQAGGKNTRSQSPADAVQVTAVTPTVEDLHRVTTQPAHLEAYEHTDIYAKASGFVSKVLVDIGDRVEQDQILAELWIPEMAQEEHQKAALVEQSRAAIKQAQARMESMQAMIAAAEAKLAESQSAIDQQEAEVAFRRSEHQRISDLVASRSVNESLQDEKLNQLQAAKAALAAATAQAQTAEANVTVERARMLQAQADVAMAEAQSDVAQANLEHVRILIKYAKIRAPYAGLITRRIADTGDFVASASHSKSEPLFTINRVDRLRIAFDIPESESAQIEIGQPTSLVIDALKGRTFPGQVRRMTRVLDPRTRTLHVEAELAEPDPALRPGMYGMISVTLAERPRTIMLPSRAIRFEENQPYVLIVNEGIVEKRPVKLGISDGTKTEILEGLSPNETVVLESRLPVRSGHRVQVATSRK